MTTHARIGSPLPVTIGAARHALEADSIFQVAPGDEACVRLSDGGHWYGHGFAHVQPYPLESGATVNAAFAVNNIQCPIWMCSAGHALLAETCAPLQVRINENGDGLLRVSSGAPFALRAFRAPTLPDAQRKLLAHVGWARHVPAPNLLAESIFCTWTQYPRCIDQARILAMARAIRARGYPCATLTIDDRWESCFGELAFGPAFPDPAGMIRELHAMGFRVLLWVTPFVNEEAATFETLARKRFLVPRRDGAGPSRLRWWGGTAGLVDLTNPAARRWYRDQLLRLRDDVGVDGFKIDGGDAKYQPDPAVSAWHAYAGASGYADRLLALFEEIAPGLCETRTAWLSQGRQILWRLGGKDSHWGLDNGLKAVVTLSLHLSLMGYDLLIPDMVPGRVQTMVADMALPTDELMVRWTEVSALMPILQFSYFPWNYAAPTERAVHACAGLHRTLGPYIASQAADRSAPLLRPLWYDAPFDEVLYTVADQFQLGADLVVCPVLDPGVTARDVILPRGNWTDAWTGQPVAADLHAAYPAPCPGMPLFVRTENAALRLALHSALASVARGSVGSGITTATYRAGLDRDLNVTG